MRTHEAPSTPPPTFPTRYVHLDLARERFGHRVDRLGTFFLHGDPLARAAVSSLSHLSRPAREALIDKTLTLGPDVFTQAPQALRDLVRAVETTPVWVDFDRLNRGGQTFLRAGLLGGLVLGAYSLIAGYCSPAGNKPLALSGRLASDTPRRLAETARFVQAVSLPDGMRPRSDGFRYTVRVRLVHESVRSMLLHSPLWNTPAWGLPINQTDMSGTLLLFSFIVLDGLDKLGFATTTQEREDLLYLWRYVGFVLGVDPELSATSEPEARTHWELLSTTQSPPDDDSRALAHALIRSKPQHTSQHSPRTTLLTQSIGYALSRHFIGHQYATWLGFPRTPTEHFIPVLSALTRAVETSSKHIAHSHFTSSRAGERYWNRVVKASLRDSSALFHLPTTLATRDD